MNFPGICALNVLLCLPLLACTADKGETDADTATATLTNASASASAGTGTTAEDTGTTADAGTSTDTTAAQPTTGDDTSASGTTEEVTTLTTGDDTTGGTEGDTSTGEPAGLSWALDVHPVAIANSCGCHANGMGGLTMTNADDSYMNLVDVQANGAFLKRVAPGAPGDSYLLNKLRGTQDDVGGAGQAMPLGGAPLPDATIDLVEQWILEGAQP